MIKNTILKILYFSIIPLGSIFVVNSCSSRNEYQTPPTVEIEVAKPLIEEMVHYFEYPGYTQSLNTVDLLARVTGFLEEVRFKPGSFVEKGEILMVIEPDNYEDEKNDAEATLRTAEATLTLSKESLHRVKIAAKTNAVSEMDVITATTNLDKAEAAILSAQSQLNLAAQNLEYCYIKAPISGRITKNFVDKGNFANSFQKLATVYEDNKMYVNFNMEDAKYLQLINSGGDKSKAMRIGKGKNLAVIVSVPEVDGLNIDGKVDYISPSVDISTGTIAMRAIIDNSKGKIADGLYVSIKIPYEKIDSAIMIPAYSIGSDQAGSYVYVVDDSATVKYRHVETGVTTPNNMTEILSGLQANERFVTTAILKVRDGMLVDPKEISIKE